MNMMEEAASVPLEDIDVSRPELFQNDTWHPWFARLRNEAPVHYLEDSVNGPFWSVTSHELIKQVDTNNQVFSSEKGGIAIVDPPQIEGQIQGQSFITLDEPSHTPQRQAVAPTVAPKNLGELEPLIRERAADILDNLPVGGVTKKPRSYGWIPTEDATLMWATAGSNWRTSGSRPRPIRFMRSMMCTP